MPTTALVSRKLLASCLKTKTIGAYSLWDLRFCRAERVLRLILVSRFNAVFRQRVWIACV